jgi:hypothetical protein
MIVEWAESNGHLARWNAMFALVIHSDPTVRAAAVVWVSFCANKPEKRTIAEQAGISFGGGR